MKTRLIRRLLNPAVNLWLRAQVEASQDIQFHLDSSDGELLSGRIAQVTVSGDGIVYQGLHLSQVKLVAQTIHFNLGQILRGKPFRLLDPLQAAGELFLLATDLNASLNSPLLASVLEELLDQWAAPLKTLARWQSVPSPHHWQDIHIDFAPETLILKAKVLGLAPDPIPLTLEAKVLLENSQTIGLKDLQWHCPDEEIKTVLTQTTTLSITVGPDAVLESLTVAPEQVTCAMNITIYPG
jgi:hypothetical protein